LSGRGRNKYLHLFEEVIAAHLGHTIICHYQVDVHLLHDHTEVAKTPKLDELNAMVNYSTSCTFKSAALAIKVNEKLP